MTNRPRLWLTLFMTVVFLTGAASGVLVSRWVAPAPSGPFGPVFRGEPPTPEVIVEIMGRDLELSEDQQRQLLTVFRERRPLIGRFQKDVRGRFEAERASLQTAIRNILTPEQFERFEQRRGRLRP